MTAGTRACFVHWPAGGMTAGRDVSQLTAHVDLLPTLIDLCGLETPAGVSFDGTSIARLLKGEAAAWPDRTLFVAVNRLDHPEPWRRTAVMTERWRLIDGRELYDMKADPGQAADISTRQPEVVAGFATNESHWKDISSRFDQYVRLVVARKRRIRQPSPATTGTQRMCPGTTGRSSRCPVERRLRSSAVAGRYHFTLMPPPGEISAAGGERGLKVGGFDEVQPVARGGRQS